RGLAEPAAPLRRERLDLVDEDHRRRDLSRPLEEPADLLLRLAVPLRQEVARLGGDEVRLRLAGHRLGQERLPGAGGTEEEEPLRRSDPQPVERLRVLEGQLDALAEDLLRLLEP